MGDRGALRHGGDGENEASEEVEDEHRDRDDTRITEAQAGWPEKV